MTHFHDRNHRRVMPWTSPGDEDLDQFLNTLVASAGPPDAEQQFDQNERDSISVHAGEFHWRMEAAQARHPYASGPSPELWHRILAAQAESKESKMTSTPQALDTCSLNVHAVPPGSPKVVRRRHDIGRWINTLAAVVLIVAIGAGYWFSGYGPGGGRPGGEPPRYAAQGVTPETSPDVSGVECDVEPLTTDQIVAYVENPFSYMARDVFGTPPPGAGGPTMTEGLVEWPRQWRDVTNDYRGEVPSSDEFEAAYRVADNYYRCLTGGTRAQLWTMLSPQTVQWDVFNDLPVYRTPEDVRGHVESVREEPAIMVPEDFVHDPDGRLSVLANPEIKDARVFRVRADWMLMDADMVMYIGEDRYDPDGELVSRTDWDATALVGGEAQSNATSLILVHSESTGRWFVYGAHAPRG